MAATLQLRTLLLARAAIDTDQARRLIEVAANDLADPGTAQELIETFLHLIQTDPADFGNMHDVQEPQAETLAILDAIEDAIRRQTKPG